MTNRLTALLLSLILAVFLLPGNAFAQKERKKVRVGWHEVPYFITDESGRWSGYSYEYQRKLAAYTGWEYEYVEGNWSELLQKLKDREIDLLSDVSYTHERAESILYSALPMGTEAYYIFISPENTEITADDYSSLNGKKVGVTKGSIQKDIFLEWARTHGIEVELTEFTSTEEESLLLLGTQLDAFVTMDIYGNSDTAVPVYKIGSSDFYFVVNKDRPDLLADLNEAMNLIQDENKYYNQQLHDKYLDSSETNRYLTPAEKNWLYSHGSIRVGYQNNYLAFCAADVNTGELTGALKDYLEYASSVLENAYINFETTAFPTAADALKALRNGEIDCMFPANLTEYDAEMNKVVTSPALMSTEMDAVVRASDQKEFIRKKDVIVAVNEGNPNYDMFLADHYPDWKRAYFKDTPAGLNAVADGNADCVIISNYRFNNISKQCDKLHLTTIYTGVDMDYCFAMREGDTELYSILARINNAVPDATIHTALAYYSTEDVKDTIKDVIRDNLFIILTVIGIVLMVILILLLRSIRAEKKILEEERLVRDLNKRVFIDALTSVRNKGAFDDYIDGMQSIIDKGGQIEYAIGVFDCNDLKTVNDENGHDKGDIYLKTASNLICKTFQHSPVFRVGGDEFAVILMNDDFKNREALVEEFMAKSKLICETAENKWEEVSVAIGIAVYDPQIDHSVNDTVRRADKNMYLNKRENKTDR